MITLITGLPGNGKTLFALPFIKSRAEKGIREVFYSGITILDKVALPWTEFNAEDWNDLPSGSMIVIDEAQFVFSKKPNGSKLPAFYESLATHRHKGFDIFLITQHPTLIDNFVRQLVGQHFHSVRKFGMERSTVYEWSAANPAPQSVASQKSAIPLKWSFPKEVYGWYKSAEVHTVKRSIPTVILIVVALLVAFLVVAVFSYQRFQERHKNDAEAASQVAPAAESRAVSAAASGVGSGAAGTHQAAFDPVADAKNFVAMQTPRYSGLPHTAPRYDALTVPVRVPVPAACIQRGSIHSGTGEVTCKCYTQKGTPMQVEKNMCIEFARNGYFQDFDAEADRQQSDRAAVGRAVMAGRPDDVPLSSRVASFAVIEEPRIAGTSMK